MSRLTSMSLLSVLLWTATPDFTAAWDEEAQQIRPSHDRPYFMPPEERRRIQTLVRKEP